jgi:biopolymer transport protein ExbB
MTKIVLVLTGLFSSLLVMAQEAGVEEPVEETTIAFRQILDDGGWTMQVLLVLSAVATFLVVLYMLTLRYGVLMPSRFRSEAEQIAESGDYEALDVLCKENGSPGARIIGSGASLLKAVPDADYQGIRDALEDEGGRQASGFWQRIQYLSDIATIAPMVGLLGTVLGMINAFVGLKEDFGSVRPVKLADGVSQALVTTAGGLIVGIVAMVLYSYFRGRVGRLVTRMEEDCSAILQRLVAARRNRGE